ncbi:MAG: hypothetical protein P8P99_12625 [Maricaulis sp.]|jgi:hypothetical protein|nr:hypothetical protein [Maricaulis sp.]
MSLASQAPGMFKTQLTGLFALMMLSSNAHAGEAVHFSPLDEATYSASSGGVVQLMCANAADGGYYLSRAVVLDLPELDLPFDILLTARHAVVDDDGSRNCFLRSFGPELGQINAMIHSFAGPQFDTDFMNDWAVLRTETRLPEGTPRVRAAAYSGQEDGQLSLLSRGLAYAPCDVTGAPTEMDNPTLIFHDCDSRPGISGSPLVTMIDGTPHVVALHVGQIIMLDEDFRSYSVARRISDEFLDALTTMVDVKTPR